MTNIIPEITDQLFQSIVDGCPSEAAGLRVVLVDCETYGGATLRFEIVNDKGEVLVVVC